MEQKSSAMKLQEWRRELQEWHSLGEFSDKLRAMCAEHGRSLLTSPDSAFFRDAHPACQLALLRGSTRVRLGADPPDFELDMAHGAREFEVAEADTPGRKRNDELKGRRELDASWLTPDVAEESLGARAALKSDGRYPPGYGLLILLNLPNPWEEDWPAIETRLLSATAAAKRRFAEVWVLWRGNAYTWLGGVPGSRVLRQIEPS